MKICNTYHFLLKMKSIVLFYVMSACVVFSYAQDSRTFEMRYFTSDPKANGVTDFHGKTEWFTTEQRVEVLNSFADYASKFWGDPQLNTPLFSDSQVRERVQQIKPQPLTSVRRTLPLQQWHAYGYKPQKENDQARRWKPWTANGAKIQAGNLIIEGCKTSPAMDPIDWRFRMKATLSVVPAGLRVVFQGDGNSSLEIPVGSLKEFEIYGDFVNRRLFLSSGGKTIREIPMPENLGKQITAFTLDAQHGKASIDFFSFYRFVRQIDNQQTPYRTELIYHEDFEEVPSIQNWQDVVYDDSTWKVVSLPSAHGSLSEAGESYYLRTSVDIGNYRNALLEIESLDPAGEVWVNGNPVAVLEGRIPRRLDVGSYLIPNHENVIAVRVKPNYSTHPMLHATSDHNIGWFLGRTSLILTDATSPITDGQIHTTVLTSSGAMQHHKVTLHNPTNEYIKGKLEVKYYPWFPTEGECAASISKDVEIRPFSDSAVHMDLLLKKPNLWSPDTPQLYKVAFVLSDKEGKPIDDWVTTTGIRFVEQKGGVLYINHRPEMLNGAQNFGYRLPIEYTAKTIRCGTDEMVMRDVMMAKRLGGNLLRIHVHSEKDITDGINDARFAEYADQLGLYLIWQTAAWLREGEAWNVDIQNYPRYMRQVYNHPSIVLWEASNHPNQFKKHDMQESFDFFSNVISTILEADTSRLVSPTSFWQHSYYQNYEGTIDIHGNPIEPNPLLVHRKLTRGSQDAYTGYGRNWGDLCNMPSPWAKSCLDAHDLCYFNFEHEESAAQPNWALAQKEPWFEIQSYEWPYERGSIGRLLETNEWRASQAFQAFSAWESMKMQSIGGVSGFSWCSMESGPNMFTYQKPLVDPFYVPKLAFHANTMAFQRIWAGSEEVDTVYGPDDMIRPVIFNMGDACRVTLTIELQNSKGKVLEKKIIKKIQVPEGRSVTRLDAFRFRHQVDGCHFLIYHIQKAK